MRIVLFLASALLSAAQVVPNRYIVELSTEPASRVSIAKRQRFSIGDPEVQARRTRLQAEHATAERAIRGLGGSVTHHYYNLTNGMAVTMSADAAARVAQMPGVRSVSPVYKHHVLMDHALLVHKVTQAWDMLGGSANAGAGIKIGILDTGIDASHPAFQNFPTAPPAGFPIISGTATNANVNNKIIVARVYSDLNSGVDNTLSDGNDFFQHGTTVAGIAAGLPSDPKVTGIGSVVGIAPGAWLGNYKIGDDFGDLSATTFLAGLEDALADGMNVVNYSAGTQVYDSSQINGVEARAIANAVAAGMLVVVAAGNDGLNGIGSIHAPAVSPAAIAVGAIENSRWFWYSVTPASGSPLYAIPPVEEVSFTVGDVSGPLADVASVASGDTHACSALPANSLTGKIALIQRGSADGTQCFFETKLNNAQAAGAIGAIVYDNTDRQFFDYTLSGGDLFLFQLALGLPPADASGNDRAVVWSVGNASLPGMLISKADGAALLGALQGNSNLTVDLDFDGKTSMPYPANQVADFSSVGPTTDANIKPDIVAVGDWLVAPTSTAYESQGCNVPYTLDLVLGCYPAYTFLDSPYVLDFEFNAGFGVPFDDGAGTSFATPMVTGAIALLMSARPGLTAAQYRSLVTNSSGEFDLNSTGSMASPQLGGGGMLDVKGALQQGLTATPTTLSFHQTSSTGGSASSSSPEFGSRDDAAPVGITQSVSISNVSSASDTFTVTFSSIDGTAIPSVDRANFNLNAGASTTLTLTLPSGLASGQYHGFMIVTGTKGQTPLRVPYWYGVVGSTVKNLTLLAAPSSDTSLCDDLIDFRLLDAVGLPLTPASDPTVATTATRASVVSVKTISNIPGTYEAEIVTGRPDSNGENIFTISADGTTWQLAIAIDNSGNTSCGGFSASTALGVSPGARQTSSSRFRRTPGLTARTVKGQEKVEKIPREPAHQ